MERELPTKLIAKQVVALLSEKDCDSLKAAVAMLEKFFANQPDRVARAYELAWLIVLKRETTKQEEIAASKPSPEADWLALRASKVAQAGHLAQAFKLLRTANNTGARGNLCRSVVFQIWRQLNKKDQLVHMCYGLTRGIPSVTTIEVGRLHGSGLMVIRNPGCTFDSQSRSWKPEPGRKQFDDGRIFLKNEEEIRQDVIKEAIQFRRMGNAELSFDRINWTDYLRELCISIQSELTTEAA